MKCPMLIDDGTCLLKRHDNKWANTYTEVECDDCPRQDKYIAMAKRVES